MLLKIMRIGFMAAILFLTGSASMAQSFRVQAFSVNDGLAVNNVFAAAQNEKGILWLGTDFGVSRFDGYRFRNYYQADGLVNKAVTDIIYAGGDSCLLASYPDALLSVHDDGRVVKLVTGSQARVEQLIMHNGRVYFYQRGTGITGVWEKGASHNLKLDSLFGLKDIQLRSLFAISPSELGFCTNKGLFVFSENRYARLLCGLDVLYGLVNPRHTITVIVGDTVLEADYNRDFRPTGIRLPVNFFVAHALFTPDGDLWLRGMAAGVYRVRKDGLQEMSAVLGLQNKTINKFFSDQDGNTWFCTDGAGLLLHPETAFANYGTDNNIPNDKITALLKKDHTLYIGTSDGLCRMENGRIDPIRLPRTGVGLQYVHYLANLQDGSIGICMAKTFAYEQSGNAVRTVMLRHTIEKRAFTSFHNFAAWQQDDIYWIINDNHLVKVQQDAITGIYDMGQLGARKGYAIGYFDNRLWLGTDKGIFYLSDGKFTRTDSIDAVFTGQVFQFLPGGADTLLIATEKGLAAKTKNGIHFLARDKNDYAGSYCCSLAADKEGGIWCATWNGLLCYKGGEIKRYGTSQGLASRICNTVLYDSATDHLVIGTDNGLSIIDKQKLGPSIATEAVSIAADLADTIPVTDGMQLPPGETGLRLYFNFPYYPGIHEVQYEYSFDKTHWIKTTTPYVYLSDISGGEHTVYARALINGKTVTLRDTSFTFRIKSPFYKTPWFWLLGALLLQLIIFLLISRRNKKIQERKLALQKQEAEYASLKQQAFTQLLNPHFIFNALNSIQHYINKQDRQSVNQYLSDFARLIRKSFEAAQKPHVSLGEEMDSIRLYLQLEKMRHAGKFDYAIHVEESLDEEEWLLPSMLLQPFLENAVLHGLAPLKSGGFISVAARSVQGSLEIVISDNGIGMEKSRQLRNRNLHQSRGMQLIRERIRLLSQLGKEPVQLTITEKDPGAENPGTVITLLFPQQLFR